MPCIEPQWVCPGERPETGGAIVRATGKVKAAGADVHIPYWVDVPLVEHRVGEAAQVPVADGCVFRAREQAGAVCEEGGTKYWATVTSQRLYLTAWAVLFIYLGRNDERLHDYTWFCFSAA